MAQKILLIEDDMYISELYQDLLESSGYEVVYAPDGEIGLEEAKTGGFDLILLDIIMPKKDGISFLKEYKALRPEKFNGQIIVMTVLNDDSTIKTCLENGAAGYLLKSTLTPAEVLKEIKNYL